MMDLPIIALFGPFGGNQMIVAMSTAHIKSLLPGVVSR